MRGPYRPFGLPEGIARRLGPLAQGIMVRKHLQGIAKRAEAMHGAWAETTGPMMPDIRILLPRDASVLDRVAPGVFDRPIDPRWTREFLGDQRHLRLGANCDRSRLRLESAREPARREPQ